MTVQILPGFGDHAGLEGSQVPNKVKPVKIKTNKSLSWYPFIWPGRVSLRNYYQAKQALWTTLTLIFMQFVLVPTFITNGINCYYDCKWNWILEDSKNLTYSTLSKEMADPSRILGEFTDMKQMLRRDTTLIFVILAFLSGLGGFSVIHIGLFVLRKDKLATSRKINIVYALIGIILVVLMVEKVSNTMELQHENYPAVNTNLKLAIQNENFTLETKRSAQSLQVLLYSCMQFYDEVELPVDVISTREKGKDDVLSKSQEVVDDLGFCQSTSINFISAMLIFVLAVACELIPVISLCTGGPIRFNSSPSKFALDAKAPAQMIIESKEAAMMNHTGNKMQYVYSPSYPNNMLDF